MVEQLPPTRAPDLQRVDRPTKSRTVSLPGLTLDLDTAEIHLTGEICISSGVLEYVAVAAGGKTYESVFSLDSRPSHLNVALLMGEYVAGDIDPEARGDFASGVDAAQRETPEGAPQVTTPPEAYWQRPHTQPTCVTFDVELKNELGEWYRIPIEQLLTSRDSATAPKKLCWAYTGSFFYHDPSTAMEAFAADVEKSIIAVWYDPSALFNLSQDLGNPYRTDAGGLEVNESVLPAKGTPIRLIIRRDNADYP